MSEGERTGRLPRAELERRVRAAERVEQRLGLGREGGEAVPARTGREGERRCAKGREGERREAKVREGARVEHDRRGEGERRGAKGREGERR